LSPEHREQAVKLLEKVFDEQPVYDWSDNPIDPKWDEPSDQLQSQIELAHGQLHERFAFCFDMPVAQFVELSEALRPAGYRPTRVRPHAALIVPTKYVDDHGALSTNALGAANFPVAAIWVRDGGDFHIERSLPADQVPKYGESGKSRRDLLLQDLSAIPNTSLDSTPQYLTIWSEPSKSDKELSPETKVATTVDIDRDNKASGFADLLTNMAMATLLSEKRFALLDLPQAEFDEAYSSINKDLHLGFRTGGFVNTLSVRTDHEGVRRYSSVLSSLTAGTGRETVFYDCTNIGSTQFDVSMSAIQWDPLREHRQQVNQINVLPKEQRAALDTRVLLATALYKIGELDLALSEMNVLAEDEAYASEILQYRALTLVRLGSTKEANEALEMFSKLTEDDSSATKTYFQIVFKGWQGDFENAARQLHEAKTKYVDDPFGIYNLACAASECSRAAKGKDEEKSAMFADQALILLETSLAKVDPPYLLPIATDPDLQALHDDSRFRSILLKVYQFAPFSGVFRHNSPMESHRQVATSIRALHKQIAPMLADGWRPAAIGAGKHDSATNDPNSTLIEELYTMVLHRPVVSKSARETLTKRQAAALTALLRLGDSSDLLARLRLTGRTDVCSSALQRMANFGVEPQSLTRLLDSAQDGNVRAFLLLSLGELARDARLTDEQRLELVERLRLIYRNDPHSGIHSAARWALRQLGESQLKLRSQIDFGNRDLELVDRHWVVNTQDQTLLIVKKGKFLQGSPSIETGRSETEVLHQTIINHDFWISSSEVTKSDWMNFSQTDKSVLSFADPNVSAYMPSLDSPMVGVTWREAAKYCNWLSSVEGIPKDQWCYEVVEGAENAILVKSSFQALTGYRLPTEAEWEFACRAGTKTAYSFGSSESYASEYARCQKTSDGTTGSVDELKPNNFGLFGMHGNVSEWCQDGPNPYAAFDAVDPWVDGEGERITRGGSWNSTARDCRSASRGETSIDMRLFDVGFRVVRTAVE
jgi:hypothetical protein